MQPVRTCTAETYHRLNDGHHRNTPLYSESSIEQSSVDPTVKRRCNSEASIQQRSIDSTVKCRPNREEASTHTVEIRIRIPQRARYRDRRERRGSDKLRRRIGGEKRHLDERAGVLRHENGAFRWPDQLGGFTVHHSPGIEG